MRAERPTILDLVRAVRDFLDNEARPALPGRLSFHARVAANALGIVERELADGPELERKELEGLVKILEAEGEGEAEGERERLTVAKLNRELSRRIRAGELEASAQLMEHLRATIDGKLAIDNPKYRPVR